MLHKIDRSLQSSASLLRLCTHNPVDALRFALSSELRVLADNETLFCDTLEGELWHCEYLSWKDFSEFSREETDGKDLKYACMHMTSCYL